MSPLRSLFPTWALLVMAGGPAFAASTESAQLAVLASNAGLHEKARACQELTVVGGPAAVPALAALLNQENLADYARSPLEAIQDPSAGAALRNALGGLSGRLLAGVVNSLGVRRETAAVPDLEKLVFDSRRGVAAEALASLGMIGTTAAAKPLQKVLGDGPAELRVPAAHAALTAATQLAKDGNAAAARGVLDAVVRAFPDGNIASAARKQSAALGAR